MLLTFSCVYVGAHYLGDVVGGLALGATVAIGYQPATHVATDGKFH